MNAVRQPEQDKAQVPYFVDELNCAKKFLDGIEPCNFPVLHDESKPALDTQSVKAPLCNTSLVLGFCNQHGLLLNSVFQTVWALALRCYVGSDLVSFGYLEAGQHSKTTWESTAHGNDDGPVRHLFKSRLLACGPRITRSELISDIIRRAADTCVPCSDNRAGPRPFNTILMYRRLWPAICLGDVKEEPKNQHFAEHNLHEYGVLAIVEDDGDELFMMISYSPSQLSSVAAANAIYTCRKILVELMTGFDKRIEDLDTLSERDRVHICTWNKTTPERADTCVHDVIEQKARAYPDLPAVCSWDGSLTYCQLDRASSKLAHHLYWLGVRRETIVPFCFDKSMWTIVATLAVLKSGGAIVPLDPLHPKSRLERIISDVDAKVLLTSPSYARMFEGSGKTVLAVSSSLLDSLDAVGDAPLVNVGPQNAAFVLFTSGSTGRPKGIIQDHVAVCTMGRVYKEALNINASSRVLQFAAYCFDVSTVDIFTTLMNGGCVCVPSEYDRKSNLAGFMNKMQVNWANLTPTVASILCPEDVPSLRTLVLAGEEVKQEHVMRWVNKVQLINCYGPAESGGCIANRYLNPHGQPETIGRPLDSAICWIVDEENPYRLASIGSIGELVVEGPALARGYLKDPERTKGAFIEHSGWFQTQRSTKRRFYRTGDLVRYRPDGSINFVGRKDTQIKLRGQRVEVSEAEYHLSTHLAVDKCVIAFPKSGQYANRLVALVQLRGLSSPPAMGDSLCLASGTEIHNTGFHPHEASNWMKEILPAYMVPTAWVVVKSIPLTTSTKIDRKRIETWLAELTPNRQFDASAGVFGADELPSILSQESTALAISRIVTDMIANGDAQLSAALQGHDFALATVGIDSIQLMTLSRRINQQFGIKIGVEKLASIDATIRELAKDVERARYSCLEEVRASCVDIPREVAALCDEFLSSSSIQDQKVCAKVRKIENVFVTGVTGFLGTELLRQLLTRPEIKKIAVHVRAQSPRHGLQRVVDVAGAAGWWSDCFLNKLEIWPGDLANPRIGLSEYQWQCLTGNASSPDEIHAIIHNAAAVRWNADYKTLKKANVWSTLQLINALLASKNSMHFVYISGGQRLNLTEEDDIAAVGEIASSMGYSQTKLVSELLVKEYASRYGSIGGHISVVKPSYIAGTVSNGTANVHDFIWKLVASSIEIKAYNHDEADSWLLISDVDRVASAVLHSISSDDPPGYEVVKILDGLLVRDFWNILTEEFGYEMQPLSAGDWWKALQKDIEAKKEQHCLWPLLHVLERGRGTISSPAKPAARNIPSAAAQAHVKAALKKNIEYLRNIGFLPKSKMQQTTNHEGEGETAERRDKGKRST